ncbi:MAG TPA: HEAT repeat domain-containing protein [Gemmatimonadaceae bacterium]|nr:HEAT repeat domain-containing protein [Gemmatimonadaceae bacterium]
MDDSFNLARHVARLISLLARSPGAVDQQKLELRTIALLTKESTLRLTMRGGQLMANGLAVPQVLTGVRDVADQMTGHAIESIEIGQGMAPAELLAAARILAEPVETEQRVIRDRLRALDAKTVIVTLADLGPTDTPAGAVEAPAEPAPGTPERIPFILARAARGGDGKPLVPHFEEAAFAVEQAIREGRAADAIAAFDLIVAREPDAADAEVRRQFVLTVRRLTRPHLLYAIARTMLDRADLAAAVHRVLVRCGSDGADALIDVYARAATARERAAALEALGQLPAVDEALFAMLSDVRPHMARVAADLIGERRPRDGDRALGDRLADADPRARRAFIRALGRYDTPFALDAVARGLEDAVVEVRLEAVAALARRKSAKSGDIIGRAMEKEGDLEVQVGLIAALGRMGTVDAVSRLAKAAEAAGGLFGGRKEGAVRVAAARALAEARTPGAITVLTGLVNDKDREVRDVASRAVAR